MKRYILRFKKAEWTVKKNIDELKLLLYHRCRPRILPFRKGSRANRAASYNRAPKVFIRDQFQIIWLIGNVQWHLMSRTMHHGKNRVSSHFFWCAEIIPAIPSCGFLYITSKTTYNVYYFQKQRKIINTQESIVGIFSNGHQKLRDDARLGSRYLSSKKYQAWIASHMRGKRVLFYCFRNRG